jgi:hypothetical protein
MTRALALLVLLAAAPQASAQPAPTSTARAAAPVDLTGQWVSYVTEDWRYRMITPPKGDYRGVPLTAEARKAADAWDPAADSRAGNQCKAYGAGGILRVPGRIRLEWQDDNTLRLDTEAGTQTRTFRFGAAPTPAAASWQGQSTATWDVPGRSLMVVTRNVRAGYLRRNGVPYSEQAVVTEYFDAAPHPGEGQLLVVTTVVDDPRNLVRPFVVSTHFKKERDASAWKPSPCVATW